MTSASAAMRVSQPVTDTRPVSFSESRRRLTRHQLAFAVCCACCLIAYQNEARVRREEAIREEREIQVRSAMLSAMVLPGQIPQA